MGERIVLFDGVCNLCHNSVQFIIKRDPHGHFKFASLQSEIGNRLLEEYGLSQQTNSIVLIEHNKVYLKSSAALRICSKLSGLWKLLGILRFVPPIFRDPLYHIVAKNRYKWYGKSDSCMLPSPETKNKFLD
nr:thiol-disulfide oxidoreductase DCC family protein [Neobacillus sp. Marseille-Q6967]